MNLLSSLLKYTADQIAALRAKDTSQDSTVSGINTRLTTAEGDIDSLEAQFTTVVSAVTTDTEVTNIRVGDDGVTYDTAGNAVRKQFSDVKSAITHQVGERTDNLSSEKWEEGYINSNGTISTDTPSLHSANYNPCEASQSYYVNQGTNYTGYAQICWYDSSYSLLDRVVARNTVVTSPATAAYFKMSMYNYGTTYNWDIAVYKGSTAKAYEPYYTAKDIKARSDIANADELLGEAFDFESVFVGCDLNNTDEFTVDKKTSYNASITTVASNPAITLDVLSGYCSYCFTTANEIEIAGAAENNTYYSIAILTSPNYSTWQVSGTTLWNSGSNASRVRKIDNNLPTESNPLTVAAGAVVVVTVKADEEAVLIIKKNKCNLSPSLLGNISPYIDVEMHNGYFYYFIPTKSGKYLRYKFVHFVDAPSNADGWVQRVVDLVTSSKVGTLMSVVRDGEWEMAIKLKDRPDFIGCMNHGSEISTIANIYFDGVKTTVTDGTKLSCKEIRVNQKSTMYDPADETTVVGYHYKTHFITADEIRIEQRIEWITDQTLDISYCGMLPATRGNDSTSAIQVTDHAYDSKTYTEYSCATTSLDPYLTAFTDKGNTFYLRGDTSKISMSLECDLENASDAFTFLSNAVYYNKVYFAHNNADYQVHSGDVWEWVSKYKIEYTGN